MKMNSFFKRILIFSGLVVFAIFLSCILYIFSGNSASDEVTVEISEGSGFNSVLKTLHEKNLVDNTVFFKIYAALRHDLKNIKPGEYRFNAHSNKKNILDSITRGNVVLYKITIPEGSNMYQIADILADELKINKRDFLRAARDGTLREKYKISGESFEGYLYPETYFFSKKANASQIVSKMAETFQEHFKEEITDKGKALGLSKNQIIILASIIEKETGLSSERELVSAVFHNRMKRGMKLQSDPTTIYGIFERYRGNLARHDLQEETPYNTYKIKGLPAGPIANPGIKSIEAAVNPAPAAYLYFVSKNDKSHVFSNNLKEHNANVDKYQLHKN
ncbi:MAG: endolytic transglycosylase MltG [Spirochaetia bacterium]|nr:endolytic transglycosylase MltG [Spirochaetia bacterium]